MLRSHGISRAFAILGLLAAHNREATLAATSAARPVTACEPLGADVGAGAGADVGAVAGAVVGVDVGAGADAGAGAVASG